MNTPRRDGEPQWDRERSESRSNGLLGSTSQTSIIMPVGSDRYRTIWNQWTPVTACDICGEVSPLSIAYADESSQNYLLSNMIGVCQECDSRIGKLRYPFATIYKSFKFEYAHILPWHTGQCQHLHGHSGKVEVGIRRRLHPIKHIVMDFYDVGEITKRVLRDYDHEYLNNLIPNPTSEALLFDIWNRLEVEGLKGLCELTFSETETSRATIKKQDVLEAFQWTVDEEGTFQFVQRRGW